MFFWAQAYLFLSWLWLFYLVIVGEHLNTKTCMGCSQMQMPKQTNLVSLVVAKATIKNQLSQVSDQMVGD